MLFATVHGKEKVADIFRLYKRKMYLHMYVSPYTAVPLCGRQKLVMSGLQELRASESEVSVVEMEEM
jgi:hypothetical protein